MILKSWLILTTIALIATAPAAHAQFLPRGFDDGVHTIQHGEQFGVTIGMQRADARKVLQKHWNIHFESTTPCREGPYEERDCFGAQDKDYYKVSGDILGGVIELYVKDDHVVAMTWWRHAMDL